MRRALTVIAAVGAGVVCFPSAAAAAEPYVQVKRPPAARGVVVDRSWLLLGRARVQVGRGAVP